METVLEGFVSKLVAKQVQTHLAGLSKPGDPADTRKLLLKLIDSRFSIFFRELAGLASGLAIRGEGELISGISSKDKLQNSGDLFQERVSAIDEAFSEEMGVDFPQKPSSKPGSVEVGQIWTGKNGKLKGRFLKVTSISRRGVVRYQILKGATKILRRKTIQARCLPKSYKLVAAQKPHPTGQDPKSNAESRQPKIQVGQVWQSRTGRVIKIKVFTNGRIYPAVLKAAKGVTGGSHVRAITEKYLFANHKLVRDVQEPGPSVADVISKPRNSKRGPGLPNVGQIFVGKSEKKLGVRGRKIKVTGYTGGRIIYKVLIPSAKAKHSIVRPICRDSLRRLYNRVKA